MGQRLWVWSVRLLTLALAFAVGAYVTEAVLWQWDMEDQAIVLRAPVSSDDLPDWYRTFHHLIALGEMAQAAWPEQERLSEEALRWVVMEILLASVEWGVDPYLAMAVAISESNLRPHAVSSKGAVGIFQLMPRTAQMLGVDAADVIQNIRGGVAYLAALLDRYDGNTILAVAAYHAGPSRVRWRLPPYRSTRRYVHRVRVWYERAIGMEQVASTL